VRQGHGAVILSGPTGSANAESASLIGKDVRMRLASAGVPFAAIASSTYDGSQKAAAPIILSFTRYNAEGPTCAPLWSQDLAHASDNQPWESFGCAQQANLAAMISDPADLLGPRAEDPRDAARRARVLEAYRQGQQTHAERSNDERVQVSDAIR
jgi:pilus assembly protein CpaD